MDINKEWQKLEQANFNQPIKKEEIMKALQLESTSTIAELKKRLGHKINWVKLFIVLFIGIALCFYDNFGIASIMGLATLTYLVGYFMLSQEHKKLMSPEELGGSVLEGLKANLSAIKSALNKERIFGFLSLPIMLVVGLSFNSLRKGGSLLEVFSNEYSLLVILGFVALILFLGYGAEKMNKMAFGEYIAKLENQIKEIEKIS